MFMIANHWVILLTCFFGSVATLLSVRCVWIGRTWTSYGSPIDRSKNPISFWISIFFAFSVGAIFFALAIFVWLRSGVARK
jgi:hypothetical protein